MYAIENGGKFKPECYPPNQGEKDTPIEMMMSIPKLKKRSCFVGRSQKIK